METLDSKYQQLLNYFRNLESVTIAFSGGVDSTFLLAASKEALGNKTIGITIDSPSFSRKELDDAIRLSAQIGAKHIILTDPKIEEEIRFNPENRCYFCKKMEFGNIIKEATRLGFKWVIDGSNADDSNDYRPGQKAIKELQVKSPLMELGFTKEEIRILSKKMGLETWDKPAAACLYSRIPYGSEIKPDDLRKVEQSEVFLQSIGFRQVRVRCHDKLARIEVTKSDMSRLFDESIRLEVYKQLKTFGFDYITVDILGYRMGGGYNELIGRK